MMSWKDGIYIACIIIIFVVWFCIYNESRYRHVISINSGIVELIKDGNRNRKSSYVKILWMYWEQGIENILDYHQGEYNQMCIDGWKKLNADWDVRVLDKNSALEYVPEMEQYEHLTTPMRSDLLRIKLLEKYGGVWADASTLPMKPLTGWIEDCDEGTGIFFYRYFPNVISRMYFPYEPFTCYVSSWFIVAKQPNHYLIKRWSQEFENRVKVKNIHTTFRYFYFHDTLAYLISNDELIKTYIIMLSTSQKLSHSRGKNSKPQHSINEISVSQHPLCYKRALTIKKKDYYEYINTHF